MRMAQSPLTNRRPPADELQRIAGVDLTQIDGVDVMLAQTVVGKVGLHICRWRRSVAVRVI